MCALCAAQRLMFELHGRVEDARMLHAGCIGSEAEADLGLVDMSCTREATNAKKMIDGVQLRGCTLGVSFDLQRRAQAPDSNGVQAPDSKVQRRAADGGTARLPASPPVGMPKIPNFFVPERWLRDVHNHLVVKMRSVLWSSSDDDVRQFFSPVKLPPEAVDMGKDWEGRFSGQVYVRFRSSDDAQRAMGARRNATMGGRPVQMQRVDPNNKVFFPPGANIFSPAAARAAYERVKVEREKAELERFRMSERGMAGVAGTAEQPGLRAAEGATRVPVSAVRDHAVPGRGEGHAEAQERVRRPEQRTRSEEWDRADSRLPDGRRGEWPPDEAAPSRAAEAAEAAEARVGVQLTVGRQRVSAAEALATCNVNEALDAVLQFLSHDQRLAAPTRHAAGFLGASPCRPCATTTRPCAHTRAARTSVSNSTSASQVICAHACCKSSSSDLAVATSTSSALPSSVRACTHTHCPKWSGHTTLAAATRLFGRSSSSSTHWCHPT